MTILDEVSPTIIKLWHGIKEFCKGSSPGIFIGLTGGFFVLISYQIKGVHDIGLEQEFVPVRSIMLGSSFGTIILCSGLLQKQSAFIRRLAISAGKHFFHSAWGSCSIVIGFAIYSGVKQWWDYGSVKLLITGPIMFGVLSICSFFGVLISRRYEQQEHKEDTPSVLLWTYCFGACAMFLYTLLSFPN